MAEGTNLKGAVAEILNERELVLNIGREHGVMSDMKFRVLEQGRPVKDPETGEELGRLQREKIRVKIIQVEPRFSIGRTYETYESASPGLRTFVRRWELGLEEQTVTKVRTLRMSEAGNRERFDPLEEASSLVKIGDPVELIREAPAKPKQQTSASEAKAVSPVPKS